MFRYISISFFLLFTFFCTPTQLIGSWEFIDIYNGEVHQVDSLKYKQDISKYGTGILTFHKDKSFNSMGQTGNYQKKNELLRMKYHDSKDTVQMKISYVSEDYLLLFSMTKNPKTWAYKKAKNQ